MIEKGLMEVDYYPTEETWADVLTKPLQGKDFRRMRGKLMNMPVDYVHPPSQKSILNHPALESSKPLTQTAGVC